MKSKIPVIRFSTELNKVNLHLLFDLHYGPSDLILKRAVQVIKEDPYAYFVLGGDNIEAIGGDDWRMQAGDYDAFPADMLVEELSRALTAQIVGFANLIRPVADRCLLMLTGNHEKKIRKKTSIDPNTLIVELLSREGYNIPFADTVAYLVINFSKAERNYQIALAHGWGGGRKPGSKINRAIDWGEQFPDANAVVVGHVHNITSDTHTVYRYRHENNSLVMSPKHVIIPGSGRIEAQYSLDWGLPTTWPGWVELRIEIKRIGGVRYVASEYISHTSEILHAFMKQAKKNEKASAD